MVAKLSTRSNYILLLMLLLALRKQLDLIAKKLICYESGRNRKLRPTNRVNGSLGWKRVCHELLFPQEYYSHQVQVIVVFACDHADLLGHIVCLWWRPGMST